MSDDVWHLFKCVFATHVTSLGMCPYLIFPHFKNCFLTIVFWGFFAYSQYKSFIGYMLWKYFLPMCDFNVFWRPLFLFCWNTIYFFLFSIILLVLHLRNLCLSKSQIFFLLFSLGNLKFPTYIYEWIYFCLLYEEWI